jgi:hypothetical protein
MESTARGFRRLLLVLALTAAGPASAATIYGTIRNDQGRPLPNLAIEVTCGNRHYDARTDARGSYRLSVPQTGRCVFKIGRSTQGISLYANQPARYDFDLSSQGTMRRR